jgi:peroxiredoxin
MNATRIAFTICLMLAMLAAIAGCQTTNPSVDLPALGALPEDAGKLQPIGAGERAPVVTVRDVNGREMKMNRVYRDQPTVLVFYRGGWCPFCTQHLAGLGAIEADLRDLGFQIVGVSPDRPAKLRESIGEHELTYTLLSDSDAKLMRAFGVAFRVDQQTYEMLLGYDMDIEEHSGRSHRVLPMPAVYLIDADGMIRFAQWDPDYRQRLSADAVMLAARDMVGGK